jgi:drug/metabolite transporter (DMT)-like permease
MKKNYGTGTVSIITATAIYGMYGVFAKLIGEEFGSFTQNWVRNLVVVLIVGIIAIITKKKWKSFSRKNIKWVLTWTLCGSLDTVISFTAFNRLQIGTTYFLIYSSMIISGFIFGNLFFKEKITKLKILSLLLSVSGLLIIYFLDLQKLNSIFIIFPLISGFLVGLWNIFTKKVSDKFDNSQMVWTDSIVAVIVGLCGAFLFKENLPSLSFSIAWITILIYAIAQIFTVNLIIYGFKHLEAQVGSLIMPIEVIFGSLFAYLVFKQVMPVTTIIGGLLIASAAAIPSLQK